MPTLGLDLASKNHKLKDGKEIKIKIWDTAGQERFQDITASFVKKANGILIVYDITDRNTFQRVSNWIDSITNKAHLNTVKILVGNKKDLLEKR